MNKYSVLVRLQAKRRHYANLLHCCWFLAVRLNIFVIDSKNQLEKVEEISLFSGIGQYMYDLPPYILGQRKKHPDERKFGKCSLNEFIEAVSKSLIDDEKLRSRSPFTIIVEDVPATSWEEFIELIKSHVTKTDFSSISKLWITCLKSYSVISKPFLRLLIPSPPTCICETIRLDAEDDVGCDIAQTIQRIPDLVKQQQDQFRSDVDL
ncbi:hypothetical protein RF11_16478 [Thelohanellus kitauei]|uniref:Uncharacterized protein n=1 Tax=Thelohanellus kitauei TaxID=669202 RepID=A0A0C2N237_THEKT|nr:hypothetical protein RF11_16478 [Thelohanellus kitauei]